MSRFVPVLLCMLFALVLLGASGCASTEPENASVRPWNSPERLGKRHPQRDVPAEPLIRLTGEF